MAKMSTSMPKVPGAKVVKNAGTHQGPAAVGKHPVNMVKGKLGLKGK